MPMNIMIRNRRKELGLTQGQIAEELGVSSPAVSKWESGTAYPDITLLPALARLLQTDPNTLMCFQDEPSPQEIRHFCQEISLLLQENEGIEGLRESCQFMKQKLLEYPRCAKLLHTFALTLDGTLLMSALPPEEKKPYEDLALTWYRQAVDQADGDLKIQSAHMLAVKYMNRGEYDSAQELIDLLPDHMVLDKRLLQADLHLKQRANLKEAEELLQRKLYLSVMELNGILLRLVKVLLAGGDSKKAARVADIDREAMELLGFAPYFTCLAPLDMALNQKDRAESLRLIQILLRSVTTRMWDLKGNPLYDRLPEAQVPDQTAQAKILPPLTANLAQAPEYDFLRDDPEFQEILRRYREYPIPDHSRQESFSVR